MLNVREMQQQLLAIHSSVLITHLITIDEDRRTKVGIFRDQQIEGRLGRSRLMVVEDMRNDDKILATDPNAAGLANIEPVLQ